MIRIVTDSTCDLPAEHYREHDVTVVPINIQFGTQGFLDGVTIDGPTFYQTIRHLGFLPKTSQPSVGQFTDAYLRLLDKGADEILSIHCTARLSGTYQSAALTAELLSGRVRVHVFDSGCGSAGLGFMVLEAARMASAGAAVTEILTRLEAIRSAIFLGFTVRDLRFAQMSGRVGKLQGSLASLLNIKPVILLDQGVIDVSEKVRTRAKSLDRVLQLAVEAVGTVQRVDLAVVHALAHEEAAALLERARALCNCRETFLSELALSLAVHFGPGTVGLIAYRV
jgi:DegV family protein with EDD domain